MKIFNLSINLDWLSHLRLWWCFDSCSIPLHPSSNTFKSTNRSISTRLNSPYSRLIQFNGKWLKNFLQFPRLTTFPLLFQSTVPQTISHQIHHRPKFSFNTSWLWANCAQQKIDIKTKHWNYSGSRKNTADQWQWGLSIAWFMPYRSVWSKSTFVDYGYLAWIETTTECFAFEALCIDDELFFKGQLSSWGSRDIWWMEETIGYEAFVDTVSCDWGKRFGEEFRGVGGNFRRIFDLNWC